MAFGKSKNTASDRPSTPPAQETPQPSTHPTADTNASTTSTRASTPVQPNTNGIEKQYTAPDGKVPDDSSKLRAILSILKKFIGVTDIAAVRFSLPAQLLEPIPNLEYWHYLDRPDCFVKIGDSDDDVERMLAALRFWFTKDLKYVHGKPCKPYNSTLGEFFRCQWNIEDTTEGENKGLAQPNGEDADKKPSEPVPTLNGDNQSHKGLKVNYMTEQTSHHPPVSAYYVDCPEKGISMRGYDQLSAKFTGTSVRVTPGTHNVGMFINLENRDNEEYQMTHPAAYLGGFLRGNLYISVADTSYVTCKKTGMKVILHYLEEGYFGKTQNKVEGVIYKCDVDSDKTTRIKDVPDKQVVGRIEGVWTEKVYFSKGSADFKKTSDKDKILLMDVSPLHPIQKICPSVEDQLPNESRRFWHPVTEAIIAKQYSVATQKKTELEEKQRERAAERKAAGKHWKPRFFTGVTEPVGKPELNEAGKAAMKGLHEGNMRLEEPEEYGAM